jgi:hypothetical protein
LLVDERYWPFDVLPPGRRSALHQQEIDFLEAAYREGFRPSEFGAGNLSASTADRGGHIIVRGRARWEVVIGTPAGRELSAYVGDFPGAAEAVLSWLRGGEASAVLRALRPHLVLMGGCRYSYRLETPGGEVIGV